MGTPAPVIVAEQADHTALGGGNSGICGNALHTYGFHLDANSVGPDDYSRWRDPNGSDGPYVDWNYCCAGDFSHRGDERLRAMHANVLARLMAGELPMICEFIGQPFADEPVYYWARWNGVGTLQRYTGAGHDTWSHISWFRSMVDQPAHLWKVEDNMGGFFSAKGPNGEDYGGQREETLAFRVDAMHRNLPAVAEGQTKGERNELHFVLKDLADRLAKLETGGVDVNALAAALAPLLPKPPTPDQIADELRDRLTQ